MGCNFSSEPFLKLGAMIKERGEYEQRTNDDALHQRFLDRFPADHIPEMTLDDYCMGTNSVPENYCWWIERGLEKVIGRYAPGSALAHLLYRTKDGTIYQHSSLAELTAEEALQYVLRIHQAIASANPGDSPTWIDDRPKWTSTPATR